jgi:hypothetical protein
VSSGRHHRTGSPRKPHKTRSETAPVLRKIDDLRQDPSLEEQSIAARLDDASWQALLDARERAKTDDSL